MSVKTIYLPELKPLTQTSDATTLGKPDNIKLFFQYKNQLVILEKLKS